jgi:hypothetical protein
MAIPISTLGSIASGALQYFGQKRLLEGQREMADDRLAQAQADEAEALRNIQGTRYSVSPALRQAYAMSKQDPVADAQRAAQQRSEAQSLEALKASGPRGLSMLGSVTDAQAAQRAQIEAGSYDRQQQAAQTFGAQEQKAMDANTAQQIALQEHLYGRAQGFGDVYRSYGDQLGVQQQQLGTNVLSGLAGQVIPGLLGQASITDIGGTRQTFGKGGKFPDLTGDGKTTLADILKGRGVFAKGGVMGGNPFKEGGELPGEFSHKSNPIPISRRGDRGADYEATGGETILNPEQSGKIEVLASEGDSPLHKYVRELFRQFNSK